MRRPPWMQRCALLVARWSGARRTEIRKLQLDCLDAYPDGTPRLRLAAGKALKERTVPLHEEAAEAIRELVALRQAQHDRGIHDPDLGRPVRYLFLRNGRLAGPNYLFANPLRAICQELGILNGSPASSTTSANPTTNRPAESPDRPDRWSNSLVRDRMPPCTTLTKNPSCSS